MFQNKIGAKTVKNNKIYYIIKIYQNTGCLIIYDALQNSFLDVNRHNSLFLSNFPRKSKAELLIKRIRVINQTQTVRRCENITPFYKH